MKDAKVLVVDDESALCEMLQDDLIAMGCQVQWTTYPEEAIELMRHGTWDVVLTDYNMPKMNGIELCQQLSINWPDTPVIVMTAFGELNVAIQAIRAGAYDFVSKPIELELLTMSVQRAYEHRSLHEKIKRLDHQVKVLPRHQIIGESAPIQLLYELISRCASSNASVLVSGESGTGKELVARELHQHSVNNSGPFVAVNCSALPDNLLESELFGHARGAFTDAKTERQGLMVQANGGTLFLDEIAEIPLALQAKILRALEERKIRPVGSNEEVSLNFRLICATHRQLEDEVEKGNFREDLFYRINVVPIEIPPLRSRDCDVLIIAEYYLGLFAERDHKKVKGMTLPVKDKLLNYAWPGNVRELRNAIERAVILTSSEEIIVEDLPEKIRLANSKSPEGEFLLPSRIISLEALEKKYIEHVLECHKQNKSLAAKSLGIDRKTLYRKLQGPE